MEPDLLRPWVEQGILGGGWIGFIWLLREYLKLQRETLTAMSDTTTALTRLADKLGAS